MRKHKDDMESLTCESKCEQCGHNECHGISRSFHAFLHFKPATYILQKMFFVKTSKSPHPSIIWVLDHRGRLSFTCTYTLAKIWGHFIFPK